MRRKSFWIATSCVLAVIGLRPVFSSGAAPASTEKVIYSFTGGADGGQPLSDLTLDAAGNLYGTTSSGGSKGSGTVFELQRIKDGWKEQVLYSFSGGADGRTPAAGVIFDRSGNLYGTTASGGSPGAGAVFKLTPNSKGGWTESVIYNFNCGSGGCVPLTDLVFDAQGSLVGTTSLGGTVRKARNNGGCGTVWELMPQSNGSWKEVTIYEFTGAPDGAQPSSAVVLDSHGNAYGVTQFGGAGKCMYVDLYPGCGTAYRLTPGSGGKWAETVIYDFARGGGFGVRPSSALLIDGAGHLLGTTLAGGDGLGTAVVLKQTKKGWEQSVLHRFYANQDGARPVGRVEMDKDGFLFGATSYGGKKADPGGVVFELRRSATGAWKERILHRFEGGADGNYPQAGVVSDAHGRLFGTTSSGGTGTGCRGGCGTVYEVTP